MYKLIATDLDGTLLDKNRIIHKENVKPIKKALEKGVKIVMCSGRPHSSINEYEKELGLNVEGNYGIGLNGSILFDSYSKKFLFNLKLDKSITIKILEEIKQFNLPTIVFTDDLLVSNIYNEELENYKVNFTTKIEIREDLTTFNQEALKVIVIGEYNKLKEIQDYTQEKLGNECNIYFTQVNFLEFTNKEAHKGSALKSLAKHLGIDMKEVIAVGDNYNDITMIQEAGLGVAVANAEQALKDVADYVTTNNNNEGVLKEVIEKYIL